MIQSGRKGKHMNNLSEIYNAFPGNAHLFIKAQNELKKRGRYRKIRNGEIIYSEGDKCEDFSFVISGQIRVYKPGESGRIITLYHVNPGECCFITASCVMRSSRFPAVADAAADSKLFVIPADLLRDLVQSYPEWQQYVFSLMASRLIHITSILDNVAFRRFDVRLGEYLIEIACRFHCEIHTTHQKIADELGTAREVVSRTLKEFEKLGHLRLSRGIVRVVHIPSFQKYINSLTEES